LHYEYRVANVPIDPFSVNLSANNRIAYGDIDAFVEQLLTLKSHFSLLRKPANLSASSTATNASGQTLKPASAE
jgi:hypothetical protein